MGGFSFNEIITYQKNNIQEASKPDHFNLVYLLDPWQG
jgi:hypothetical protein